MLLPTRDAVPRMLMCFLLGVLLVISFVWR